MASDSDMDFVPGDFPTKGCFKRDDNVMYWSEETVSEMAVVGLPGRQEVSFVEEIHRVQFKLLYLN